MTQQKEITKKSSVEVDSGGNHGLSSKAFLAKQLEETAQIINWAINLVPKERLLEIPPHSTHPKASDYMKSYFGLWSAYRILFHLVHYEENSALPNMKLWLGEQPNRQRCGKEKEDWEEELRKGPNLEALLERFHSVRKQQTEVINKIQDNQWQEKRPNTNWGTVSVEFIVTKSIQHTLEHGNKILRNVLFWDGYLRQLNKK
ncbi:MAG: DinB family protein [Promethearchaeota archaeon]